MQIVGLETEQKKDKFNRLGNFSLITSLIDVLMEAKEFELTKMVVEDMVCAFS